MPSDRKYEAKRKDTTLILTGMMKIRQNTTPG
jgi:hypothetical protein